MSNKVFQLALFGDPVAHSLSPKIHTLFAQQFNLSINYDLIQVSKEDFITRVKDYFAEGGHGANITLPHKSLAMNISNLISQIAKQAQAVNTLYFNADSQLCADNTDGIGFVQDLSKRCQFNCQDKKILILGAGGATQGIAPVIMQQNPQSLLIANRSIEKAEQIAAVSAATALTLDALAEYNEDFDLIIHASSLGHQGQTLTFLSQHMHPQTRCYDLSYGQAAKAFIDHARTMGVVHCCDGIGMLIEQAACAFNRWFGLLPDTSHIAKNLTD
jgi:shikimate dehydrogenase